MQDSIQAPDNKQFLSSLLTRMQEARVLVVGDLILDDFVSGGVSRLSREAPIPILVESNSYAMPGGGGNVASNVAALGAHVTLISVVGDDAEGRELAELLYERTGHKEHRLVVDAARVTARKTRYIAKGQQMLRVDREQNTPIAGRVAEEVVAAVKALLPSHQVLALSDNALGTLAPMVVPELIKIGRALGKVIVADPRVKDFSLYKGATIIKPNKDDLIVATGLPVETNTQVEAAARKLIGLTGAVAILATRSEKGMSIISAEQALHIPAEAREVFDVSGAGDTVLATFCSALAARSSLAEAAWVANQASSIVVGKAGTAVVRPEELLAASGQNNPPKLCSLDKAVERVELWRRQGHKVGFTNGCFDLLHPGHVSSLRQARAECDKLVVGLNSDSSVQKLKGPSRPVMNEEARAIMLAALQDVDCVVIFSEDRPLKLLEALAPDVLIKGADYAGKEIPEFEVVRRKGGKVVFARLEEGFSTTKTIAKLSDPLPVS